MPSQQGIVRHQRLVGRLRAAKQRAKDGGSRPSISPIYVPKTGAAAWVDCLCIPSDAKHKDNAYKFLDFILDPK